MKLCVGDRPRLRCVELRQAGWKPADIARTFGLTAGWVSQTLKTYREQDDSGLATGKRTGAPSRLTTEQLDHLTKELDKGAEQHGFAGQVWTRPRVNEVITKLFGISYDPPQVGRLLKKVGWTGAPERPTETGSASPPSDRRSGRIYRLLLTGGTNAFLLSKKAKVERRTILYVDESACYLLPFVAHSWAPCGQTPLLMEQAGRAHLSLIAAISPTGRSYLAGQDKQFDSDDICWFLGKLC